MIQPLQIHCGGHLARRRKGWDDNHHIVGSQGNDRTPRGQRTYFDHLPLVRRTEPKDESSKWFPDEDGSSGDTTVTSWRCTVEQLNASRRKLSALQGIVPSVDLLSAAVALPLPQFIGVSAPGTPANGPNSARRPSKLDPLAPSGHGGSNRGSRASSKKMHSLLTEAQAPLTGGEHAPAYMALVEWGEAKYVNMVGLWRKLDQNQSGLIHKTEMVKGLKELGYTGKPEDVWTALDMDKRGTIDFFEFAPRSSRLLAGFKRWAYEKFGSAKAFFKTMDADKNSRLGLAEIMKGCKQHGLPEELEAQIEGVFWLLDDTIALLSDHKGSISAEELAFLDQWKCPAYFWGQPDATAEEAFRKRLMKHHRNNPILAWRDGLDRAARMVLSWEDFEIACKELHRMGVIDSAKEEQIAGLYVSYDMEKTGLFRFGSWDQYGYRLLAAFVVFARQKENRPSRFIRSRGDPNDGGVTLEAFDIATEDMVLTDKDLQTLFFGLSRGYEKVFWRDVSFLDSWDLDLARDAPAPDLESLLRERQSGEDADLAAQQCQQRGKNRRRQSDKAEFQAVHASWRAKSKSISEEA